MSGKVVTTAKAQEAKQTCPNSCKQNPSFNSLRSSADKILQLQRTAGNQAVQRLIKSGTLQAKLKISQPNDIYEQEADRVAEHVMRMPEPKMQLQPLRVTPLMQRQVPKEKEEILQAKETASQSQTITPSIESRISELQGGGQPLDPATRAFFELRFGQDFSEVRVHTDAKAAEVAKEVNARAFTVGKELVFGEGNYSPGMDDGQRLIAHELTHVIQQSEVSIGNNWCLKSEEPNKSENLTFSQLSSSGIPFSHKNNKANLLVQRAVSPEQSPLSENPEGQIEEKDQNHYIMWDFDIGSSELKPNHMKKLNSIANEWRIFSLREDTSKIRIDGHSSKSEPDDVFDIISFERAFAVENYFLSLGIKPSNMLVNSYGPSIPWFPNIGSRSMAHNRRVEVTIIRPDTPKPQVREIPEQPKGSTQEMSFEAKTLQSPKLGIPNIEFSIKRSFDDFPPLTFKYIIIYPGVDVIGKVKFKTDSSINHQFSLDEPQNKLFYAMKVKAEGYQVKLDEKGVTFSFENVEFKPEIQTNLIDLRKPISINFILRRGTLFDNIYLGQGMTGSVEGEMKGKIGIGLSPEGVVKIGQLGLASGSTLIYIVPAAGSLALLMATPSIIEAEKKKGIEEQRTRAYRDMYAWRIAGEAWDDLGYGIALARLKDYKGLSDDVYTDAYRGWKEAEEYIEHLRKEHRLSGLLKLLTQRYGYYDKIQEQLLLHPELLPH